MTSSLPHSKTMTASKTSRERHNKQVHNKCRTNLVGKAKCKDNNNSNSSLINRIKCKMWWVYTTNILTLRLQLTNTMLLTPWQVLTRNKTKWESNNSKRHRCSKCNKCKWCNSNSRCSNLLPVASLLNSSTARCSSNSKTYRSMQELWTCKTKCNNSNSNHSGLHSSNKTLVAILRIHRPMLLSSHKQIQEVSETSARSNLLLRIMIVTKVSTTVVLSTWAQDSVMKLLPLLVNNSSHHLVMLTSRTLSNGEDKVG